MNSKNEILKRDNIFFSKIFIFVLLLKIIFSFFFASHYMTKLFIPFINWFVINEFNNPWDYFLSINQTRMFPYPTVMLWLMTLPRIIFSSFLSNDWHAVTSLHLFAMRVPLLIFDILLFYSLLKLLPTKKDITLYAYWCSPIIFFINYIHGQLDIIPTTIFLFSIILLINRKYLYSSLVFGIALATKTHIFIFFPFFLLFLFKQRITITKLTSCFLISVYTYIALIYPYMFSGGFIEQVFKAGEQQRMYEFVLPVSSSLSILICPVVIFFLFIKFASYKKLNKEILLMFSGIVFASLVVFVTPMPGWFIWSLPFLIYFYLSNEEFAKAPFILYNFIYAIYFILFFEKDISFLKGIIDISLINNLALSLLLASVAFTVIWMFQTGVKKNEELILKEKPILVGIGGDSGTGKHTVYDIFKSLLGEKLCVPVFGDNFHKWERNNENWKVFTHLNPLSNKLYEKLDKAVALKSGREIEIVEYDHTSGKFKNPSLIESNKFIFFIGLHPFYLSSMRDLVDIKIFVDADEELRNFWKVNRDVKDRGYDKSKVIEQINIRKEDSEKYIKPQKEYADLNIKYLSLTGVDPNTKEMPFKVVYQLDNSINIENLLNNLNKVKSLNVEHTHVNDLIHQELTVQGLIPSSEVMSIAYNLGLNYDELIVSNPEWLANYSGITQLMFLLIYNHKMKAK